MPVEVREVKKINKADHAYKKRVEGVMGAMEN